MPMTWVLSLLKTCKLESKIHLFSFTPPRVHAEKNGDANDWDRGGGVRGATRGGITNLPLLVG